jgi:hypothetical protein
MLSRLALTVALALAPLATHAEESALLAEYWADSGSLPPEYAWETKVSITADGKLTLIYCVGYETEGPGCKTRKAKVDEADRAAILAAVMAGDLVDKPARQTEDIPVGGGATGGRIYVDGQPVSLPAFPVDHDAARVGAVLNAIEAAIPDRFRDRYFDRT